MTSENGKFELTDEELARVSGGFDSNESDPDAISPYITVYLIQCLSCEWRDVVRLGQLPQYCPRCLKSGRSEEIEIFTTDTVTDDIDMKLIKDWWVGHT